MDTSRWTSLLLMGSDSHEAPVLPVSSGKATSKPHTKDRPRLSAEKGLPDDPCVNGKQKKQRRHDWNGKAATGIISSSPGTPKIAKNITGGNGDSAVVRDPSNAHSRYPSVGNGSSINVDNSCNGSNDHSSSSNGKQPKRRNKIHRLSGDVEMNNIARKVPSSSSPHETEHNSTSIPLAGAAAHAGKTGKKRKRKATDNLVNGDAEGSPGVRPTRVSPVANGHSSHANVKDHRIGRLLSSPDNLPAGTERPRPNTLNLAYQAQKAAAESGGGGKGKWKLGGDGRGGDANGGAEQDVPLTERAQYVGLDCEMVGVGPQGRRSALARCCLVDWDGDVLYDKHVNPAERVTDFRTFVSGVKAKHLKGALSLRQCQKEVAAILKNKFLVGHALSNDLKALMMTHPQRMTRDTATYRPYRKLRSKTGGKLLPMSLKKLALEHLGRTIQEGQHNPAEDARAAMDLYKLVRTDWEKSLAHKGKKKGRRGTVNQMAS